MRATILRWNRKYSARRAARPSRSDAFLIGGECAKCDPMTPDEPVGGRVVDGKIVWIWDDDEMQRYGGHAVIGQGFKP